MSRRQTRLGDRVIYALLALAFLGAAAFACHLDDELQPLPQPTRSLSR